MRMIMRAYDYVFYTFYRFWEIVPSRWWSEWKAGVTLEVFFSAWTWNWYSPSLHVHI